MKGLHVVALPGDGVGPEVTAVALDVLKAAASLEGIAVRVEAHPIGSAAIDAAGDPLPEHVLAAAKAADAVLLGAVGSVPDLPPGVRRAEAALLQLRAELGVWANLRPVRAWTPLLDAVPVRPEVAAGADLLIVRELSSGLYYGRPQGIDREGDAPSAVDTLAYTWPEIERIVRAAFEAARTRRGRLASIDKANVLATSRLWREVVEAVAGDYPDVTVEHVLVDAAAMRLVRAPAEFDVVVTENTFGDILSDEASMLAGSLGMLPSASLGTPGASVGLYEPVHGTAPDIAGQDRANPIGAVLSVAMLLRHTAEAEAAATRVEAAVEAVLAGGARTADLQPAWGGGQGAAEPLGTRAFGERLLSALEGETAGLPRPCWSRA